MPTTGIIPKTLQISYRRGAALTTVKRKKRHERHSPNIFYTPILEFKAYEKNQQKVVPILPY